MRSYETEPPVLIGGALSVDFINTLSWRGDPFDGGERLTSYDELVHWGVAAGAVEPKSRGALLQIAAQHPVDGARALSDAIALREAVARLFSAGASGASAADLSTINRLLRETASPDQLIPSSGGGYARTRSAGDKTDLLREPLYRIACSAADIATSATLGQIGICAGERCRWMFIDTSKSRRRRWCNMKTCGNRSKVRRFYSRTHNAADAGQTPKN